MCKVGASCASIGSDEGRMVLNTYLIRKVNYLQVGQLIGPPPRPLAVLGGDQVLRFSPLPLTCRLASSSGPLHAPWRSLAAIRFCASRS